MSEIKINDLVQAHYNSGTYIGKVIEDRGNFLLVEVLAVTKHPMQGDLHNRCEVEGIAFFERKALAYREKMNARKRTITPYVEKVPEYKDSLKKAIRQFEEELLAEETPFHQKSLEKLHALKKHYYNRIFQEEL